jgi:hypothetical protein
MSDLQSQEGDQNDKRVSSVKLTMNRAHTPLISDAAKPVKVTFELEPSDWHDHATESVWAVPLGGDKYQVQNVPFHAYGVSYYDVVTARPNELGQLIVQGVDQRGGHSTYRVILNPGTTDEEFETAWNELGSLGSTYERATDRLVAIDVPPETDIYKVYAGLESGERNNVWGFEEAQCSHPLKKRGN